MNGFSPLTRRVVAFGLPILFLLLFIQLIVAPLITAIIGNRDALTASRAQEARLAVIVATPLPRPSSIPIRTLIRASNSQAAARALGATVVSTAIKNGLKLTRIAAVHPDRHAITAVTLTGTGSEEAIVSFIAQTEQDKPIIRFRRWQIRSDTDSKQPLVFDAEVVAAWMT